MPATLEDVHSTAFQEGFCAECLREAKAKGIDDELNLAGDYVLLEWPRLSDRTAGCIDAYVINLLEKFMHGTARQLIASNVFNITPDDVLDGKLLVIDMPILKYREPGQFVQMVWKLMVQLLHCREITPETRDICLWSDESQLFALPV